MRKRIGWLLLAGMLVFTGCSSNSEKTVKDTTQNVNSEMFTDRDMEVGYDEATSIKIQLDDNNITSSSDSVSISGNTVTIKEEGTYILNGSLSDGMVMVDASDTAKIQIVLNGVDITSKTSAALYVKEADKVFVTTAKDSKNSLRNGGTYIAIDDNNIDAVIFSKSDLTLNGTGSLTIDADAGHGIVSKDDLVLTSGTYEINAASHGLSGKDSVRIANGTYTIISVKDGIHAENADDESLGFVYIADGKFTITADGDGISAGNYALMEDGEYTIEAGGGSENSTIQHVDSFGPGAWETTEASSDTTSMKAIKAISDVTINNGTYTIDAADDGIHSNQNVKIAGGTYQIKTADDGMHADETLTISDGNIDITESYEGLEGLNIKVSGGTITLVSSDDGINAAGGNDNSGFRGFQSETSSVSSGSISITGGTLKLVIEGDGIDSNGDITISGGEIYVNGPANGGNASLDYDGEAKITGGIFVAAGPSEMALNFSTSSTQGAMLSTVSNQTAGTAITLKDASGNTLVSWEAESDFSSVLISLPELEEGSTYTLETGSSSTEITMTSLIYGSGGMQTPGNMQSPGGMEPGNHQGMGINRMP